MKFKKGDKVVMSKAGGYIWNGAMDSDLGKMATVTHVDSCDETYLITVHDNGNSWWVKEENIELAKNHEVCENCRHIATADFCEECCHNYTDRFESKPIDDGKREMQWILCSEKLPEESGYYLVSTKYNETKVFPYWQGWNRTEGDDGNMEIKDYVVAWMPFPEHYDY